MKFNWGTGIFIFLILFLLACAGFIFFAFQQDVNLVHKDYYEKGVDYSEQMKVEARSSSYKNAFTTANQNNLFLVNIEATLSSKIDSGSILMFRPSSSKQDIWFPLKINNNEVKISKKDLVSGRYILKIYWYSEGLKYEFDKPVNIQ